MLGRGDIERTQGKKVTHPLEEESGKPREERQETMDAKNLPQPDFIEVPMIGSKEALKSGKVQEVTTTKEEQSKDTEERKSNNVSAMLNFFANRADLLWFSQNEKLKHLVIPRPMSFVQSLRAIIGHDVLDKVKGEERSDLYQKGTMTFSTFEKIYSSQRETAAFTSEQMWHFLTELGLAYEIMGRSEERRILVPSLISDKTKEMFIKKIEEGDNEVIVQYQLQRNAKTLGAFDNFVKIFTWKFFKEGGGGEMRLAFSEKVENKKLGAVAGVCGQMALPDSSERMDFILLHCEIQVPEDFNDDGQTNPFKLIQRQLRVHLRPSKGSLNRSAIDALRTLDEAFTQEYPEVKRGLLCKECRQEDVNSIAPLDENFQLREFKEHCNTLKQHDVDGHMKNLFFVPGTLKHCQTH